LFTESAFKKNIIQAKYVKENNQKFFQNEKWIEYIS